MAGEKQQIFPIQLGLSDYKILKKKKDKLS